MEPETIYGLVGLATGTLIGYRIASLRAKKTLRETLRDVRCLGNSLAPVIDKFRNYFIGESNCLNKRDLLTFRDNLEWAMHEMRALRRKRDIEHDELFRVVSESKNYVDVKLVE